MRTHVDRGSGVGEGTIEDLISMIQCGSDDMAPMEPGEEVYVVNDGDVYELFLYNTIWHLDHGELAKLEQLFPEVSFVVVEPDDTRLADSVARQHGSDLAKKVVESIRKRLGGEHAQDASR